MFSLIETQPAEESLCVCIAMGDDKNGLGYSCKQRVRLALLEISWNVLIACQYISTSDMALMVGVSVKVQ